MQINISFRKVVHFSLLFMLGTLLMSSCGVSKSALALTDTIEYKIKQVHMEPINSSYDNLTADYLEMAKPESVRKAEAFAKDTLVYMAKTACYSDCPVFSITVLNGEDVIYHGEDNVTMQGIFESKLEAGMKEKITALVGEMDLLRMYTRYPRSVTVEGQLGSTKLLLSNGSVKFPTLINSGAPQELTNIELYLEQLINELSWVQI